MRLNFLGNEKTYKEWFIGNSSNFRIVSMSPGDFVVAGCFVFLGGLF